MSRDWSVVALLTALAVFAVLAAYAMAFEPDVVVPVECPTLAC